MGLDAILDCDTNEQQPEQQEQIAPSNIRTYIGANELIKEERFKNRKCNIMKLDTIVRQEQDLTVNDYIKIKDNLLSNNIRYQTTKNAKKIMLLQEKEYPKNLDSNVTFGAINIFNSKVTNGKYNENENGYEQIHSYKIIDTNGNFDNDDKINLMNGTTCDYYQGQVLLNGNVEYVKTDNYRDVFNGKTHLIRDTNDQWIINVPIRRQDGTVETLPLCADPGANSACVRTQWAVDNFGDMIMKNKGKKRMSTPGGVIAPKYCMWMTFPTNKGFLMKRRMYLVDDLPVDVLADINMLKSFGYKFPNEVPPIFRHSAKEEKDYELNYNEKVGNADNEIRANWFDTVTTKKLKQANYIETEEDTYVNTKSIINMYDEVGSGDHVIYNTNKSNYSINQNENDLSIKDLEYVSAFEEKDNSNQKIDINKGTSINIIQEDENQDIDSHLFNIENVNIENVYEIENNVDNISNMINYVQGGFVGFRYATDLYSNIRNNPKTVCVIRNGRKQTCPTFHRCLFIMSRNSFLATQEEIDQAKAMVDNFDLLFNDFTYLKSYEHKYGSKYKGLYEAVMAWIKKNKDIFAKKQFDRKTMNVKPARLGIKPECREYTMYASQYPINQEKRLYMINYTLLNEQNGFWRKIDYSLHCIPYTMIPKKKKGVIYLYRPAFDARVVNQFCTLMPVVMPTLKDFRELHSIKGLVTMADIKNCFDCIPLDKRDQKYAVAHTPLGLFMMNCLTYGFMNSAPEAQKIVNPIALFIQDCLIYIDDICIKHRFENGTVGIIVQLDRLAVICRKYNIQLNPVKFFPACDYSESFGYKNTMIGEMVSKSYQRKMLAVHQPTNKAEVKSLDGLLNYMNDHIYRNKILMYWINRLAESTEARKSRRRLKWDKFGRLAWQQLQFLLRHLPLLHHPTPDGLFCLQTDGCNYGVGGILWQKQLNDDTNILEWVMISMFSKVLPKTLRNAHSMVIEAYAIVVCIQHWQFYLIKRHFIISTDNMPIANIFGRLWKDLSPITQKQLLRFRIMVSQFDFSSYHVKGLQNPIADALSRFTIKLINKDQQLPPQEQQYPLEFNFESGEDMNSPPITEIEKRELEEINRESQQLSSQLRDLKSGNYYNSSNNILLSLNCKPTDCNKSNLNNNIDAFIQSSNNSWINFINSFIENQQYLIRDKYRIMLNRINNNNLLRTNEDSICNVVHYKFIEDLDNAFNHLSNLEKENLCNISLCIQQNDKLIKMVNQIDQEYDVYDDIEDEQDLEILEKEKSQIMTRSKTKRKEQKRLERSESESEDSDSDYTTIESNERFDDIRMHFETRENVMNELFGHRKDMDIGDFRKFSDLQKADNVIKILISLFEQDDNERKQEDLEFLKKWDVHLYNKLMDDKIRKELSMMMVIDYDTIKQEDTTKLIVPFNLRGKLIAYAHHSVSAHHESYQQTLNKLINTYWWGTMKKDIKEFYDSCVLCQFVRGSPRKRAPRAIRDLSDTFDHVFADFLGPVYGRYYILVLVDYKSGYCELTPTDGCDALTVIDTITQQWVKHFGWFRKFESDWGSGFNNKLLKYLSKICNFSIELAEPRNHRSIGKVERVIGMIQNILNRYNLLLEKRFTNNIDDINRSWRTIEILIPFIQFSLNQRRTRISSISPNMLIFGKNLNDTINNIELKIKLENLKKEINEQLNDQDLRYFNSLMELITKVNNTFVDDWKKYTWLSVKEYNNKNNITTKKIKNMRKKFKKGKKILYFIGDKQVALRKWREKWSGPWIVEKQINDVSLIIMDPETGNQKRVSYDRIKLFKEKEYEKFEDFVKFNKEYIEFENEMLQKLTNYKVGVREQQFDLDYTNR